MDNIQFNRKTRQEIQCRYILNAIQIANPCISFDSHKEMCEYIVEKFFEYRKELNTRNFAEWLETCPSCIEIAHHLNEIVSIGTAWGFCKTPHSTDRFIENWYERIAVKFILMCHWLRVEF